MRILDRTIGRQGTLQRRLWLFMLGGNLLLALLCGVGHLWNAALMQQAETGLAALAAPDRPADHTPTQTSERLTELQTRLTLANQQFQAIVHTTRETHRIFLVLEWGVLPVLLLLGSWMAARFIHPLQRLHQDLKHILEDHTLTKRLDPVPGVTGELALCFNTLLDRISLAMSQTGAVATSLQQASHSLTINAAQTRQGLGGQEREIGEVTTRMQAVESEIKTIVGLTQAVVLQADQARTFNEKGQTVMNQAVASMRSLDSESAQNLLLVESFVQSAERIGGVVEMIRSVADQTNLLALNAAIEAARAGDSGRGFAVVASEVRALSNRTQGATTEIHRMIEALRVHADKTREAMAGNRRHAARTLEAMENMVEPMQEVGTGIHQIAERSHEVNRAVDRQTIAMTDINRNATNLQATTHQAEFNAKTMEQLSFTLTGLVVTLVHELSRFNVSVDLTHTTDQPSDPPATGSADDNIELF